jgi:hypothetical protein
MTTGAATAQRWCMAAASRSRASAERTTVNRQGWMLPALGATTAASSKALMSASETSLFVSKCRTLRRLASTSENSMRGSVFGLQVLGHSRTRRTTLVCREHPSCAEHEDRG